MTRKHFELIAATVRTLPLSYEERALVAAAFAERLASQNARFDRARFLRACVTN